LSAILLARNSVKASGVINGRSAKAPTIWAGSPLGKIQRLRSVRQQLTGLAHFANASPIGRQLLAFNDVFDTIDQETAQTGL
jgi:hypothetical protein